ncbi:hypothetical protein ACEN88_06870 [Massilia sp. CT11-108]
MSTALSVALIGGIFYTVLGGRDDPAPIAHAFVAAALCIAFCLGAGAVLGMTLARRAGTGMHPSGKKPAKTKKGNSLPLR